METYHQMKVNWKILRSFKSDDQHVDFPSAVDHFGNDPASDFCFGRLSHPKTWCDRESWEEIAFQETGTKEGEALHALRGCMGKFPMSLLWMSMKIPAFPVRPRSRRSNNVLPQRLGGTPRPSVRRFSSSWSSWQIPHPEEHYQIASIHLIRVLIKNWKHSGKTSPKRTRKLAVFLFFGGEDRELYMARMATVFEFVDEVRRIWWSIQVYVLDQQLLEHNFATSFWFDASTVAQSFATWTWNTGHISSPLKLGKNDDRSTGTGRHRWVWSKEDEGAHLVWCVVSVEKDGSMKTNMLDVRM